MDTAPAPATADARLQLLDAWIRQDLRWTPDRIEPASVDASFRRYFRVWRGGESFVAMDAPPEKQSIVSYIEVAEMLSRMDVTVPRIFARDEARGFLLASDFGTRLYLEELTANRHVETLYRDALRAMCNIQAKGTAAASSLPPYDREFCLREMNLMPEWFCVRHLRLTLGGAEEKLLAESFDLLASVALEQPQVFVHRDFHSRNLMVLASGNPGILDFQDAVRGPVTYDPVSLLKDCYVVWPRARVRNWLAGYRAMSAAAGVAVGDSEERYLRWFDFMGAQRHLKVLGIFSRLFHRDGKPRYLPDLPRVLAYVTDVCGEYSELAGLGEFLERRVRPVLSTAEVRA